MKPTYIFTKEEEVSFTREQLMDISTSRAVMKGSGKQDTEGKVIVCEQTHNGVLEYAMFFMSNSLEYSGGFPDSNYSILSKVNQELDVKTFRKEINLPYSWTLVQGQFFERNATMGDDFETLEIYVEQTQEAPEKIVFFQEVMRKPVPARIAKDTQDAIESGATDIVYRKADGTIVHSINLTVSTKAVEEGIYANNEILQTFQPQDIQAIDIAMKTATPTLLVGHTGLGKTTLVKEIAKAHNKNLVRFSVHSGITADEVIGKWLAIGGETVWQDGILTKAVRNGDIIVIDEINACPADVLFALHPLLDDDRHIILAEKDGEIVKAHDEFRFFATMNPQDDYAGTKELNMAFLSRFNAVITLSPFDSMTEVKILERKGIHSAVATNLVSIANNLRAFQASQDISWFCGTRDIISTGLLIKEGLNKQVALTIGLMNKMNQDDKTFVISKLGSDIKPVKTAEQKRLEELEKDLKDKTVKLAQAQSTITIQQGEYEKLKQSGATGLKITPEIEKALKVLGVLPMATAPVQDKTVQEVSF